MQRYNDKRVLAAGAIAAVVGIAYYVPVVWWFPGGWVGFWLGLGFMFKVGPAIMNALEPWALKKEKPSEEE